ncbi:hypothetical protein MP228_001278 [Amoeboaphelidium protococcarum]|nr:hypothetical protein MP228_001278 [Amoeboaphelidium protococcarum]
MAVLRRSNAVWDLTQIPSDTFLFVDINVEISLAANDDSVTPSTTDCQLLECSDNNAKPKVMQLREIDTMQSVRQLKKLIEPLAYHMYLQRMEPENVTTGRNVDYYAHVKSPTADQAQSPVSDYHSEDGQSPTALHDGINVRHTALESGRSDSFMDCMKIQFNGQVMQDSDRLFQFKLAKSCNITCHVEVDKLRIPH